MAKDLNCSKTPPWASTGRTRRASDGHFIGFEPMICSDDTEAITNARRLVDGHDIEFWSGTGSLSGLKRIRNRFEPFSLWPVFVLEATP
jgi:hypothetical protein